MTHTPRLFTADELATLDSLFCRMDTAIRSGRAVSDLVDVDSPAAAVADASADLQVSLLNSIAAVVFPADFAALRAKENCEGTPLAGSSAITT